jgi:hypothetical protein
MIDVKEAVKIAVDYLRNLYDSTELKDILLEEVVLSDDEKYWYVTLGFSRKVESMNPWGKLGLNTTEELSNKEYKREYKVFQIDTASGQVRSMKIRAA